MPKRTRSFRNWKLEKLSNPSLASNYLDAAMEDSQESYLKALREVAQARQMSKVAKETGVQRESLYRILSETGNPTLETLRGIYDAIGLKLTSSPKEEKKHGSFGVTESIHSIIAKGITSLESHPKMAPVDFLGWFKEANTVRPVDFILPAQSKYGESGFLPSPDMNRTISIPESPSISLFWNGKEAAA